LTSEDKPATQVGVDERSGRGRPAPQEFVARRRAAEEMMAGLPRADDVEISETRAGGVRALACTPVRGRTDTTILYHHGGGYRLGSADMYQSFASHLASLCGATVLVLDYRLAPEHPFPAALTDAAAAYQWAVAGTGPQRLVLAGDSAGGGLVAGLLLDIKDRELPPPAATVLMSPWVDLRNSADSFTSRADTDNLFSHAAAEEAAQWYLAGHPATDPLASPLLGDWTGLPPTLIHVSEAEVLYDDGTRLADTARAAGVDVRYEAFPDVPHIWHTGYPRLPAAVKPVQQIAAFIDEMTA
jgi:acetyl esterase/lipase